MKNYGLFFSYSASVEVALKMDAAHALLYVLSVVQKKVMFT